MIAVLKRFITTYRLLLVYIAALLVGATVAIVFLMQTKPVDETVVRYDDTKAHLATVAAGAKTEKLYSQLPEDQRQSFLEQQAEAYALDPRFQEATPDTLRGLCVEKSEDDIIAIATRVRAEEGRESFKNYAPLLVHAKMTARANCYASFDPTGKEDVPEMMAHP